MRSEYVQVVLQLTLIIPAGKVLSYGDIAELLAVGGPRQIGQVMSWHGSDAVDQEPVPWWRVIRADGRPPQGHAQQAFPHYLAEGTPLRGMDGPQDSAAEAPESYRVNMSLARWVPDAAQGDLVNQLMERYHASG